VFSWLSDRFGRRSIFTFALLWYSVGAFIMAFQDTAASIDLWRLIASIGLGVELVNVDAYVSELVPKSQRGPAFAYNQFIMFTAVPVVAFIAWQLVPQTIFGLDGWRWVVIIGSLGAAVIWWIRRNLPESPRWLDQHGRTAEAERLLDDMERHIRAETGQELPPPEIVAGETERKTGAWMEMWNPVYRGRTIMLVIYNLFQTIGYYGFSSWVQTLLVSQGIEVTKSLAYTFIIAIAAPIGPLVGVFFADRFERKWQIAWAAIGIAVFGLLFAQQKSATGVIAFGLLITLCNNWMSFSFHAYSRPGGGLRLFVEPVFRDLLRLHHRLPARQLRHHRRVRLHCRRHGGGVHRHRRLRPAGDRTTSRSHRDLNAAAARQAQAIQNGLHDLRPELCRAMPISLRHRSLRFISSLRERARRDQLAKPCFTWLNVNRRDGRAVLVFLLRVVMATSIE
jgi:MFS family permease